MYRFFDSWELEEEKLSIGIQNLVLLVAVAGARFGDDGECQKARDTEDQPSTLVHRLDVGALGQVEAEESESEFDNRRISEWSESH